jgi:hypothetical protein
MSVTGDIKKRDDAWYRVFRSYNGPNLNRQYEEHKLARKLSLQVFRFTKNCQIGHSRRQKQTHDPTELRQYESYDYRDERDYETIKT